MRPCPGWHLLTKKKGGGSDLAGPPAAVFGYDLGLCHDRNSHHHPLHGQLGNRLARIEHRAGPDVLAPKVQIRHAGIGQTAVEEIRPFMKLLHRLSIARAANVMPAQDELLRQIEIHSIKKRQSGDQRCVVDESPAQCRHAHSDSRSHAAKSAD